MALRLFVDLIWLAFNLLLDPCLLLWIGDVHVFEADGSGIGVAHDAEDVGELHACTAVCGLRAHEALHLELSFQVPNRQPVARWIEFGVHRVVGDSEWIEVRNQVTADSVIVDEAVDLHLSFNSGLCVVDRVYVTTPLHRVVGNPHALEDVLVELMLTDEQFMDGLQEVAALRALNDTVVIGGGNGDDL